MKDALRRLIEQWREAAVWEFEHGSPEFGKGCDQCADELEALLAQQDETKTDAFFKPNAGFKQVKDWVKDDPTYQEALHRPKT
jgi:hypothetical protein